MNININNFYEYLVETGVFYRNKANQLIYKRGDLKREVEKFENIKKIYDDCENEQEFKFRIMNHIENRPICPYCGNVVSYNVSKGLYRKTCGDRKCYQRAHEQTMMDKYGHKYTFNVPSIKEKVKNSFQEKYGVDNPGQSQEIREKIMDTFEEKYGLRVKAPGKIKEVKEKTVATNIKKYNGPSPFCSDKVVKKSKATMKERYGVEHALQYKKFKEKAMTTMNDKYGVNWLVEKPEVRSAHCGHSYKYKDELYDSTWEVAYYIYETEVNHRNIKRNIDKYIEYTSKSGVHRYYPDFIDLDTNEFIEVKADYFLNEEKTDLKNVYKKNPTETDIDQITEKSKIIKQYNIPYVTWKYIKKCMNYVNKTKGKDFLNSLVV